MKAFSWLRVTTRAVAVAVVAAAAITAVTVEAVAEEIQTATGQDQTLSGIAQEVFKQRQVRMMVVQQ